MSAAIVLGHDLDVFVLVAPVQLVLNPEVGEVDLVVEVRQLVLVRPALDLARVAIGAAVAVRSAAIMFLEPLLILAFELLVEDDAMDICALFVKTLCFAQVGAIQLRVVRQLARPVHAGVEGLVALAAVLAAVALQKAVTAFGERDGAIAAVQLHGFGQALIS
jgi:hypothetical protein